MAVAKTLCYPKQHWTKISAFLVRFKQNSVLSWTRGARICAIQISAELCDSFLSGQLSIISIALWYRWVKFSAGLGCPGFKIYPSGLKVAVWLLQNTIKTLLWKAVFSLQDFFLHNKKKSGTSPRFWPNEPGKYTKNCREIKSCTIPSYSWEKSVPELGIEVGEYFSAITGKSSQLLNGILPGLQIRLSQWMKVQRRCDGWG